MHLSIKGDLLDEIDPLREKMYRTAKRLLISKEEAEDATQEILAKIWQMPSEKLESFRSKEAYAMTMLKNHCLDQLRAKRSARVSLDDVKLEPIQAENLSAGLDGMETLKWVKQLIEGLPEQERMIVQMRDIEQLEFSKIASTLALPEGTVRVYLSRARKKIKNAFLKIENYGTR